MLTPAPWHDEPCGNITTTGQEVLILKLLKKFNIQLHEIDRPCNVKYADKV
jgi:hypothetical protein